MKKYLDIAIVVFVALWMLVVTMAVLPADNAEAQRIKDRFNGILVEHDADIEGDLDVDGTANLDAVDIDGTVDLATTLDLGGDLDMQNNIISNIGVAGTDFVSDGSLTIATDLTVDDTFNIDDTDSALTGAQTITPTYSYLQVSPTAVLTITLGVPAACDGDFFIVHNLVTTSTVVVDTGATAGGGNITLGQDDPAGFICGDGVWVELFSPDNS